MAKRPGQRPEPVSPPPSNDSSPQFGLEDFLQEGTSADASPTPMSEPSAIDAFVQDAIVDDDASQDDVADDDFSWFQDAEERESEDVAAWGSTHEYGDDFVWFQEPAQAERDVRQQASAPSAAQKASGTDADDAPHRDGAETSPAVPSPAPAKPSTGAKASGGPSHFRPEIEGLRAVSVLMIVAYHVWLGRVSGGVDVFLFISAFLLGSSFARRLDARRPFGPVKYWLRTFTRLMPPAVIAILGTLVASAFILPPSAWQNVISQAIASATYTQNIWLSITSVDYYALDASTASPLQHFWSLSLQGQVFLVWPLLFICAAFLARKARHPRRIAFALFAVIFAASLAFSISFTATNQTAAYFSTPARAWEVAAGTLLALALPWLDRKLGAHRPGSGSQPRHRTLRALAGWIGFAMLVSLGLVLDVQGLFPGWVALWPLAAAGLIIVAGYSGSRFGFDRVLTMKAPRALASSSYSLYLVHWPILTMWLSYSDQPRAGIADGLAVIAVAMLVAWFLTEAVDSQFRSPVWKSAPAGRSLAVIGLCLALVLGGALGWRAYLTSQSREEEPTAVSPPTPTPTIASNAPLDLGALSPQGFELSREWPNLPEKCADTGKAPYTAPEVPCEMLLPAGASHSKLLVMVGSSHSRQFIPALLPLAKKNGWQIINLTKDGCNFVTDAGLPAGDRCRGYYDFAMRNIRELKPDYVATVGTLTSASAPDTRPAGAQQAVQGVLNAGSTVFVFRDTPRWPSSQYECAEKALRTTPTLEAASVACAKPAAKVYSSPSPLDVYAGMTGSTGKRALPLDLSADICAKGTCEPLAGTTYIYMDNNHLTKVFSRTLAPRLESLLHTSSPTLTQREGVP